MEAWDVDWDCEDAYYKVISDSDSKMYKKEEWNMDEDGYET